MAPVDTAGPVTEQEPAPPIRAPIELGGPLPEGPVAQSPEASPSVPNRTSMASVAPAMDGPEVSGISGQPNDPDGPTGDRPPGAPMGSPTGPGGPSPEPESSELVTPEPPRPEPLRGPIDPSTTHEHVGHEHLEEKKHAHESGGEKETGKERGKGEKEKHRDSRAGAASTRRGQGPEEGGGQRPKEERKEGLEEARQEGGQEEAGEEALPGGLRGPAGSTGTTRPAVGGPDTRSGVGHSVPTPRTVSRGAFAATSGEPDRDAWTCNHSRRSSGAGASRRAEGTGHPAG